LTSSATWASDNTAVASVSTGTVHGVTQGTANVSATQSGVVGQAAVHVGPAVVSSIAVTATPTSVPLGDHAQMAATATMSDGTTQNVTGAASWTSSDTGVATVAAGGAVSTHAAGSADISATYQLVSGSATVTVTAKVLRSIAVDTSTPEFAKGRTSQLTATGTYSDGSTADLTSSATWTSSDTSVAGVSTSGLVTGNAPGVATISAAVGPVSGDDIVTVDPAVVTALTVAPVSQSVPLGDTQQFTATATWSDTTTTDVTGAATWTAGTTSVATVDGNGLAHSVGEGTTTISAAYNGSGDSTTLAVTPHVLRSITV